MSATPDDPFDHVYSVVARAAEEARRVLAGPDGPLALALVLGLVSMLEVSLYTEAIGSAMIANLIATVPIALSRTRIWLAAPLIVFGVLVAIGDPESTLTIAALLSLVIALYLFAVRYRWRWSALLAFPFLVNAIEPLGGDDPGFPGVLLLALVIAALALGESQRERGEAVAERDESRRVMAESLQQQAEMTERARIARELHDVIGHSISVMGLQAGAVRRLLTPEQEREREALLSVERTGRDAVGEMRRLLGILRANGAEPELEAMPTVQRAGDLVADLRRAGLDVELHVEGELDDLPPGRALAAFRILQEALTNVLKHAPGAHVEAVLRRAGPELEIEVVDSGGTRPAEPAGGGHGLVGMRERVALYGGTLEAGPEGPGFSVLARFPATGA
jgi:signal transduction histidine kinase